MNRIARLCLLTVACLALPLASGAQQGSVKARSYEVSARMVTLPPSDPGLLTVMRDCASCAPLTLTTAGKTAYQLDDEVVDLAQLRQLFATNPDAFVLVVVDTDYQHVKSVRMWAPRVTGP